MVDQAEYDYSSNGQRVKKAADSQGAVFHYDQYGQLIAETDAAGNLVRAYVWLHGQPLAQITADGSVYYYHNDHLGTPQRMADQAAAVVWAADYLPFGKADVTLASVENNLRFSGQYFDSEIGLHYNYWRYYDPKIGRYLRPDPSLTKSPTTPFLVNSLMESPQGFNHYSYVSNNPILYIDKLGLCKWSGTMEYGGASA